MATPLHQLKKYTTQCFTLLHTAESQDDYTNIIQELAELLQQASTDDDRKQLKEHAGIALHKTMQSIQKAADKAHQKALTQIQRLAGEHALTQQKLEETEQKVASMQAEIEALLAQQAHPLSAPQDLVPSSTHEKGQESDMETPILLAGEHVLAQQKLKEAERKVALMQAEIQALRAQQAHPSLISRDLVPNRTHENGQKSDTEMPIPCGGRQETQRPQTAFNQMRSSDMHSHTLQNEQTNQTSMFLSGEQFQRPPALPIFFGYRDDNQHKIHNPQWDSWYKRFELHFGNLSEANRARQLLLHLGGEAYQFQSMMLDQETRRSYNATIDALARHYMDREAPFAALCEFNEMRQGTQNVRDFAQRFQNAYAQAVRNNPSARRPEESLKTMFVSKISKELHRILVAHHPNYHLTMPLHQIVAELADIEASALPVGYNKPTGFNRPNNAYRGGRGGNARQPNGRHQPPRRSDKPCDICGLNNHTTDNCRSATNKQNQQNPTDNHRGDNSRGRGKAHELRTQYIGINANNAQQYTSGTDNAQSTCNIQFDASTNAILNVRSEQPHELAKSQREKLDQVRYQKVHSSANDRWQSVITPRPATSKLVINGTKVLVLIDTGSQANLISRSTVKKLCRETENWKASWAMRTMVQSTQPNPEGSPALCSVSGGVIAIHCLIDVECGGDTSEYTARITFAVTKHELQHIVLGLPALKALGVKLELPGHKDYIHKLVNTPRTAWPNQIERQHATQSKVSSREAATQCESMPAVVTHNVTRSTDESHTQSHSSDAITNRPKLALMKARKTFEVQPGSSTHAPVTIDQNDADIHNHPCYFVEVLHTGASYVCDTLKAAKALCYVANQAENPVTFPKGVTIASIVAYNAHEEAKFIDANNLDAQRSHITGTDRVPSQKKEMGTCNTVHSDDRWQERIKFITEHLKFGTALDAEQQQQIRNLSPLRDKAFLPCLLSDTEAEAKKIPSSAVANTDQHGKMNSTNDQAEAPMDLTEPPKDDHQEPCSSKAPAEHQKKEKPKKTKIRGAHVKSSREQQSWRQQKQRERDMYIGARIARESYSNAMQHVMRNSHIARNARLPNSARGAYHRPQYRQQAPRKAPNGANEQAVKSNDKQTTE